VATSEGQLLDATSAQAAATDVAPQPSRRTGRYTSPAMAAVGLVGLVVAGWGLRSVDMPIRALVALVSAALLWRGLQAMGMRRYGPTFRLGLVASAGWLVLVAFLAVFADILPIEHWTKADLSAGSFDLRPGLRWPEVLGRTTNGYSELSHVIYGARTSLTIGVVAVAVGVVIGIVAGLFAGWYGKAVDGTITVATNTILAFPPLILILAIVAVYGSSVRTLALALAAVSIPTYTRLMRAQTLAIRQREYVQAADAMGASNRRLMWREVLPNAVMPVLSYSFIVVAVVIVAEGSLSYLGVGVPSPQPSWGGMIAAGQRKLKTDPHLVFVPAIVMFLTVLALNRFGEWARKRVMGGDRVELL
jgi:peptide/nickel transport system permease protein